MRYKIVCEVTEKDLQKILPITKKIIPIYKSQAGTADINWIHENKNSITDAACEYVWNLYCNAFMNEKILSKNKFYELVRSELNLKSKMVRFTDDVIKYSFVSKSIC